MNTSRVRITIRWCAWLAATFFIVVLVVRDVGPSRQIIVAARFDRATPRASVFGPPARVEPASNNVRVVGEPVYVNIRLPRWYRSVIVDTTYGNPSELPVQIGVRTSAAAWTYDLRKIASIAGADGMTIARESFDLQRMWQVERNVYQFIIAAPGASSERALTVHSFRVTAQRDPICIGRFCI